MIVPTMIESRRKPPRRRVARAGTSHPCELRETSRTLDPLLPIQGRAISYYRSRISQRFTNIRLHEYTRRKIRPGRAVCFGKSFPALSLSLSLSLSLCLSLFVSLSFSVSCFLSYTSCAAKAKAEAIKSNRALDYPCFSRAVTRGRAARP